MVGNSLNVEVLIGLALLDGSGGARPTVVTIGKRIFRHYFGDFPPRGLLVQILRR